MRSTRKRATRPATYQPVESVPVTSAEMRRAGCRRQARGHSQDSTGRDVAHTVTHRSWVNVETRLVRRTGCLTSRAESPGASCAGAVVWLPRRSWRSTTRMGSPLATSTRVQNALPRLQVALGEASLTESRCLRQEGRSSTTGAMARCQGKSEILAPPDPGGCGSSTPGPSRIRAPSLRSAFTLCLNGARPARAELTKGNTTTGIPRRGASAGCPGRGCRQVRPPSAATDNKLHWIQVQAFRVVRALTIAALMRSGSCFAWMASGPATGWEMAWPWWSSKA